MTAARHRRKRSWQATTAMRRVVGILRDVNDELVRANEAIFRPAGAPPPRLPAGTSASSVSGSADAAATGHAGQAA